MTEFASEKWQVFISQYPQMIALRGQLAKREWFVDGGWTAFIGAYHAGIYMQVYKPHWFNHTGDGIHLETALNAESLAQKRTSIDLHITHKNLFDRERFNAYTIPRMQALTSGWEDDFWFKSHTLTERLGLKLRFTETGFGKQLAEGFTRLSVLGAVIDDGLAQL